MKKYIIFDLDGTLINSTHSIQYTIEEYFLKNYPDLYDKARYYFSNSQGQGLKEQLEYILEDKNLAEKEAKNIYKILGNLRDSLSFFPGVQKKIKELYKKGYKLFLTTGSSTEFATKTLKDGGIFNFFEKVIGSDEILKGKEHLEIFKNLTGDKDFYKKSIYIGDGNMDKIYANQMGIDFVRVGNRGEEDEKKVGSVVEIDKYLKLKNNKAFTLVELIVVITILVILSTIGFISFQNYSMYARNSIRKSNASLITSLIKIKQSQGDKAPMPENYIEITANGELVGYQGELTNEILGKYNLHGDFKDPLDNSNYLYSIDKNLMNFTVGIFLEENKIAFGDINIGKKVYASDGRILKVNGDKFGIILKNGKSLTGSIDIVNTNEIFEIYFDNTYKIVGTGSILIKMNPTYSCKRILELGDLKNENFGDGYYIINPTGDKYFKVYCDMNTDGGGRTRYLNIKGNYSFEDAKKCLLGEIINNELLECFNPNFYNIPTVQLMSKVGNSIEKFSFIESFYSVNSNASLSRPHEEPHEGYKCKGHIDYMVGLYYTRDAFFLDDPSDKYGWIRLGKSRCYYGNTFGAVYGNKYLNSSGINTQGNWESEAIKGEIYIR